MRWHRSDTKPSQWPTNLFSIIGLQMTNPDNGRVVFDLLAKADSGNSKPLNSFVRRSTSWAVSADRACMLGLRQQFGALREGNWYPFSAQPESNPWPSTRSRHALALVRRDADGSRSWHELTLPTAVRIESVLAEGDTFRMTGDRLHITATGTAVYRVIADSSFGPPGLSEAQIEHAFNKLTGRTPMEVVGPAEAGEPLGRALPLFVNDPMLGTYAFQATRPARYTQTSEYGPTYSLFCDQSGSFEKALARARAIEPSISAHVVAGAGLVRTSIPKFCEADVPRLLSADFLSDGTVTLSIDDGTYESLSAELELRNDGTLSLIGIAED